MRLLQIAVLCFAWVLTSTSPSEAATKHLYSSVGYCVSHNIGEGNYCLEDAPFEVTVAQVGESSIYLATGVFVGAMYFNVSSDLVLFSPPSIFATDNYQTLSLTLDWMWYCIGCGEGSSAWIRSIGPVTYSRVSSVPIPPSALLLLTTLLVVALLSRLRPSSVRA